MGRAAGLLFLLLVGCGPIASGVIAAVALSGDSGSGGGGKKRPPPPPEGQPDLTFGLSGYVLQGETTGVGTEDRGYDVAIDSDGRILVCGVTTGGPTGADMILWRFQDDGTLDPGLFGQGWITHDNAGGGAGDDYGRAVALDSLGRIVVAGHSEGATSGLDIAIWRLDEIGGLDLAFNGQGWVTRHNIAGGGGEDRVIGMTVDDNDRILVTGYSQGSTRDMYAVRYETDGTLDATFGSSGIVVHADAGGAANTDGGQGITVDDDGRVVIAGFSTVPGGGNQVVVWRYTPFGILDTSFGGQGFVLHDISGGVSPSDRGEEVMVNSAGRITVAGWGRSLAGSRDMVIWRFLEDGTLDSSFAGKGWVSHHDAAGGSGADLGYGMAIDASGGIIVSGDSVGSGTGRDAVIWRFEPSGFIDALFGTGGVIVEVDTAGGSSDDAAWAVAVDGEGRIVAVGESRNASSLFEMVLWRYR